MFKFLFGGKGATAKKETQRETVERALAEVNGVLALMADKATVGVDLNTGLIEVTLPEQMPDEALALPKPEAEEASEAEKAAGDEAAEKKEAA